MDPDWPFLSLHSNDAEETMVVSACVLEGVKNIFAHQDVNSVELSEGFETGCRVYGIRHDSCLKAVFGSDDPQHYASEVQTGPRPQAGLAVLR